MAASSPVSDAAMRRSSGRVRKQPDYTSSPFGSGKRKRGDEDGGGDTDMVDDELSEENAESDEGEPDAEEVREKAKKARKTKAPKKQPAAKKPKVNGTLPIRVAGASKKKASRKAKAVAAVHADDEPDSLYAQVFGGDVQLKQITADWLKRFEQHEAGALGEVVNFVLKCAGCGIKVDEDDIGDPDSASNRLIDIQGEYQATSPTEYPLAKKGKAGEDFKETMAEFMKLLIQSFAASGILYEDNMLMENTQIWLGTMASAANRAFRHTSTIASLAVISGLCIVAAETAKQAADLQRQADVERRKPKPNTGRIQHVQDLADEKISVKEFLEGQIQEWFDVVFMHRYRDLDPTIRRDCVAALGDWIVTVPHYLFDGSHMRYLGWMLSDTHPVTRAEVVKQLRRLYNDSDKAGGLKTFTERFRGRMVEMAVKDAETHARVSAIDLLSKLREDELLEPDQIDEVGSLIYDADPKIRGAVAGFFVANVNDVYANKVDELGGQGTLDDVLPDVSEDNFEALRMEWLKFKCLAEMMVAYDPNSTIPEYAERNRGDGSLSLRAGATDSMFTLAAQALFNAVEEIKEWQALSGYLLFDHSSGRANGVSNDTLSMLKHECTLDEREETVLLEVVSASVKQTVLEIAEKTTTKSKLTKRQKEDLAEEQEEAARHLAGLIPKLLKKFGDVPSTAAAVLRMQSVLNLPSLQDITQDSVTYGALLDDIRKQFLSHGTDDVLGPASEAILHAKSYGELDDTAEEKLAGLWEDVIGNLTELINPETVTVRGASDPEELLALSNNLLRITRLSHVSDPTTPLEGDLVSDHNNEAAGVQYRCPIDYIIALIDRGQPSDTTVDHEASVLEDLNASRAALATVRYLQWKFNRIIALAAPTSSANLPDDELQAVAERRDAFANSLEAVLRARKASERVCADMTMSLLELHSSATVLKNVKPNPGDRGDWDVLIMDLHEIYLPLIWKVFSATEKNFAKLTNKKLEEEEVDVDAEPMDEDTGSESEEDESQPTQSQAVLRKRESKQRQAILAESQLCELTRALIFAVHANIIDAKATSKRLERNKTKLGQNYKELLQYLDRDKLSGSKAKGKKGKAKPKAKGKAAGGKSKPSAKSNAIVAEDEEEDEIEDGDEDAEEALRRADLELDEAAERADAGAEGENGEVESVLGD